ncbi:nucleotide-binding universal stress UspA family protein [Gillisia mitskevichiae]|uniref:Nucleotide-binding universal stress UspA family protein n=1 Tax=Gillisia mitskevichiae TaxID=270921 RepID=A0A495PSU8_9FLAO|nr:universal stress protein [Gillisia mitskevichiae]RKS53703.1 nucleotide-binding universal stress UspA family protein [Gillisia mitskevichiae]
MKNILIPTDFSENSWNAIFYALSFFQKEEIYYHLIHFVPPEINSSIPDLNLVETFPKNYTSNKEIEDFEKLKSRIFQNFPESQNKIATQIMRSKIIDGIRQYVLTHDIDLIIMGTKGASNYNELPLGSLTNEVITKVKCPILVIPEKATFKVPISLAFPTDFNIIYKSKIINSLIDIVKIHNASLKILRVAQHQKVLNETQVENREYLKKNLTNVPYSFHVIDSPNLENGLQYFVNTMKVDMIAMIAKNINFFQRILFNPRVAKFNYHREIPFLVLHE